MRNLILMIQFLTRIPIPVQIDVKEDSFVKGVAYYPIVGLIIGCINGLVYFGFRAIMPEGSIIPFILALLSNTLVTGAFHIDGLADTCDGIYSARPKDQMLEIMKDSRLGTNGAIAIAFDFILRLAFLNAMPSFMVLKAIILSPVIAKTLVGVLIYLSKYARKSGLAGLYLDKMTLQPVIMCQIVGLTLILCVLRLNGLIIFVILLLISIGYKQYITKKIDGMTGDTLGAANEVIEVIFLMIMVITYA